MLSRAQSELAETRKHLTESRNQEKMLVKKLKVAGKNTKNLKSQIDDQKLTLGAYKIKSKQELVNLRQQMNHYEDELKRLKSMRPRGKREDNRIAKRPRRFIKAEGPPQTFSLDSFQDTVDQVSEAHVKGNGHPSVERLNNAIDSLVFEVLEQVANLVAAPVVGMWPSDGVLFSAWAKPALTEECRGLLLDSALHSIVLPRLYRVFFQSEVVTHRSDSTEPFEDAFKHISKAGMPLSSVLVSTLMKWRTEPWAASQRWRALTASATSLMLDSSQNDEIATSIERIIVKYIAWAYGQHHSLFSEPMRSKLFRKMNDIVRDAHYLSLVIKRDILSVEMSVTLGSCLGGSFDP